MRLEQKETKETKACFKGLAWLELEQKLAKDAKTSSFPSFPSFNPNGWRLGSEHLRDLRGLLLSLPQSSTPSLGQNLLEDDA